MANNSVQLIFVTSNKDKLREVKQILEDNVPIQVTGYDVDLLEFQSADSDDITRAKCMEAVRTLDGPGKPVIIEDVALNFNAFGGNLPGPYVKWFLAGLGPDGLHKMLAAFPDKTASAVCTFALCPPLTFGKDVSLSPLDTTNGSGYKESPASRPFKLSMFLTPSASSASINGDRRKSLPKSSSLNTSTSSLTHQQPAGNSASTTDAPPLDIIPNPKDIILFKGVTTGRIVEPRQGTGKDGQPLGFGWDSCFEPDAGPNANLPINDPRRLTYAQMTGPQKNSISHRSKALINLRNYIIKKYLK